MMVVAVVRRWYAVHERIFLVEKETFGKMLSIKIVFGCLVRPAKWIHKQTNIRNTRSEQIVRGGKSKPDQFKRKEEIGEFLSEWTGTEKSVDKFKENVAEQERREQFGYDPPDYGSESDWIWAPWRRFL